MEKYYDTCELTQSEVLTLLAHFEFCKVYGCLDEEDQAVYDKLQEWRNNQD